MSDELSDVIKTNNCKIEKIRIASLGDSHSLFGFAAFPEIDIYWLGPVTMHRVGRDGLRSLLTYKRGFLPWNAKRIKDYDYVIVSFGEIDARAHVEKISAKSSQPVETVINDLVASFMEALNRYFDGDARVVISCVPPAPKGQSPTQPRVRNLLNDAMKAYSQNFGFAFLDYRDVCQDGEWLGEKYSDGNVHVNPDNTEFIKDTIESSLNIKLNYLPVYSNLFLRPMSAKTLFAKMHRIRKKLLRRV